MITPMDIRTKTFKKAAVGGYDKKEVDEYMEVLFEDYEKVYKQSIEYMDKVNTLTKLVDGYRSMEDSMTRAIMVAQTTAEEVEKNAQDRAKIIVDEANLEAKKIIDDANEEVKKVATQLSELKSSMEMYKSTAKGILQAQLETIENINAE